MDCSKCIWPSAETCKVCKQEETYRQEEEQMKNDPVLAAVRDRIDADIERFVKEVKNDSADYSRVQALQWREV